MAKAADKRKKVLGAALKDALNKQGIDLDVDKIDTVLDDMIGATTLFDCGGGGCKKSCNTGCSDGCKDTQKTG